MTFKGTSKVKSMGKAPRSNRKLVAKSDFGPIRRRRAARQAIDARKHTARDLAVTSGTPVNIQHNLNTQDLIVQIWEAGTLVSGTRSIVDDNNIEVTMTSNTTITVVIIS